MPMEANPPSSAATPEPGSRRASRRLLKTLLKVAFTLTLLWLLYRKVDFEAFTTSLRQARWAWLPLFFAIAVGNMWLSSLRWRLFLRADGADVPVSLLFRSHWISSFFNFFLPSNIGGDVYRIADIGRRSGRAVGSAASVFADRLSGFVAMSLLGFVFPLLGLQLIPPENRLLLLIPAVLFAGFLTLAFLMLRPRLFHLLLPLLPGALRAKAARILDTFFASIQAYAKTPAVPLKALGLSLVFQFLVICAVWVVGEALRIPVPFQAYCVFVPFVCLLESVPLSLNGIGLRDTGYCFFFTAVGLASPETAAAGLSLCYVSLTLLYALGGGILFLLRQANLRV